MRAMRDFPSCFSESGVQVADSSSSTNSISGRATQNLVTCVYHCQLQGISCFISITWTKNLMGQGVSIEIQTSTNQILCKVDVKPWLFSRRKGFRSLQVLDSGTIEIYWDFSSAKFNSGPEPIDGFYLAVIFNQELILLIGDLGKEVYKKIYQSPDAASGTTTVFIAKREHIFGKKLYSSKAQFCDRGKIHDIVIECETGLNIEPSLMIRIDSKAVMQVKRLRWKFRGNHTITVDGLPVQVYWDVHSWLFGNHVMGNAVFLFQTCLLGSAQKLWRSPRPLSSSAPVFSWSGSQKLANSESQGQGQGFSLILYAWKN